MWFHFLLDLSYNHVFLTDYSIMFCHKLMLCDLSFVSQIEIVLGKTENFDELMAANAEEREIADGEEQS